MTKKLPLPRFEIDRKINKNSISLPSYHYFARYLAKNGKEVWRTSEVYSSKRGAERAILILPVGNVPIVQVWK